jgi:hypothetical protein
MCINGLFEQKTKVDFLTKGVLGLSEFMAKCVARIFDLRVGRACKKCEKF